MPNLFDTILQNFQESKRRVTRYLSVGIVFTLLCFFYVVDPYFQYKSHQESAEDNRENIENELQGLNEQLKEIRKVNSNAQQALKDIQFRINTFPDHLHNEALPKIMEALNSSPSNEQQQIQQAQPSMSFGEISLPPEITDFNEVVNWYIQTWFKKMVADLKEDVVDPISGINKSRTANQSDELELLTQTGIEKVNNHLETIDPGFWHRYQGPGGKVSTADNLQRVVNQSFGPVQKRMSDLINQTSEDYKLRQASLKTVQDRLKQTESSIHTLGDRISSLNSPFGPIPLSATELIILFPVLLVILMILTVSAFCKSSQLYIDLWQQFSNDPEKTDIGAFQHYTNCWYLPPYQSYLQPSLLALYVLTIVGIFIYASLLIYGEPNLFTIPGSGADTVRRTFFTGAYTLGILVLAGCIWIGYKECNRLLKLPFANGQS